MKKLLVVTSASIATLALLASSANAATSVTNTFTVSASVQTQCTATNSSTQTIAFGTYVAFQATPITPSAISLAFNCTHKSPAPTITATPYDNTNGATSGNGVLAGLLYTLSTGAVTAGTAGSDATTTTAATADPYTVAVTGTMAAGQPGQCTTNSGTACSANHTRTLTLSF